MRDNGKTVGRSVWIVASQLRALWQGSRAGGGKNKKSAKNSGEGGWGPIEG
jgi:hypothetical protein